MNPDEPIPAELLDEIERQKQVYREKLPGRMEAVETALDAMGQGGKEKAIEARRLVHNLAGSAETFGLASVGNEARRLLDLLDAVIESGGETKMQAPAIRFLLSSLKAEAAAVPRPTG